MFPVIVQHSEALAIFISSLNPALYQPQIRHLLQIVDALIASNERKTLSDLSRLLKDVPDPKALADFFRESPWTVDLIGKQRRIPSVQARFVRRGLFTTHYCQEEIPCFQNMSNLLSQYLFG